MKTNTAKVTLSWDPSRLSFLTGKETDLDISAVVYDMFGNSLLINHENLSLRDNIGAVKDPTGAVTISPDNKNGRGKGADETLTLSFSSNNPISRVVVIISSKGKSLKDANNAQVKIKDGQGNTHIRYEDFRSHADSNYLILGSFERDQKTNEFSYIDIGLGYKISNVNDILSCYNFGTLTPIKNSREKVHPKYTNAYDYNFNVTANDMSLNYHQPTGSTRYINDYNTGYNMGSVSHAYNHQLQQPGSSKAAYIHQLQQSGSSKAAYIHQLQQSGSSKAAYNNNASSVPAHGSSSNPNVQIQEPTRAAQQNGLPLNSKQGMIDLLKDSDKPMYDLVKKAEISLEKKGLTNHCAKVGLCLDISGSMSSLYREGKVQELAKRVLAIGMLFDDNASIDVFSFGEKPHYLGTCGPNNYKEFIDKLGRQSLEGATYYSGVMDMIQKHDDFKLNSRDKQLPVYMMFITDGDNFDKPKAEEQMRVSSNKGVFWQFMGIGDEKQFSFLKKLDDMPGRAHDNADFFAVYSPTKLTPYESLTDEKLFDKLMTEYPRWLNEVKKCGIIKDVQQPQLKFDKSTKNLAYQMA